jgi:hypothetical protein
VDDEVGDGFVDDALEVLGDGVGQAGPAGRDAQPVADERNACRDRGQHEVQARRGAAAELRVCTRHVHQCGPTGPAAQSGGCSACIFCSAWTRS